MDNQQLNRYSRNILLREVGIKGQEKLLAAKVLTIGCGGLGTPVLQYLTAVGIGKIGMIDFDSVDETNLQRQVLFNTNDIGKNKAYAAKEKLEKLNPHIELVSYPYSLTTSNSLDLFSQYDIIVDGTDNFSTRYLINDACILTNKPLVYGAINQFDGQVAVFNHDNGPSYRCIFPTPPKAGSIPSCSEAGVLGVLPGIIGSMQANEVIKLILGLDGLLSGKLLNYNALETSQYTLKVNRVDSEINKVLENRSSFETNDYDLFCGISKDLNEGEVSVHDLNELLSNGYLLIDIRDDWEQPRLDIENIQVTFDQMKNASSLLDKSKNYIIACNNGERSKAAIQYLKNEFGFEKLFNLKEGLTKLSS